MVAARLMGVPHPREARAPLAPLRGDVVGNSALPLQAALAELNELKRALLLSQLHRAAAEKQVAILTRSKWELKRLALQRDFMACAARGLPDEELSDFPLATGLDSDELSLLRPLLTKRAQFRKGDVLCNLGRRFAALYAIRSGSCKSVLLGRGGEEQVAGYHILGDVVGIDGLGSRVHECDVIALEDTQACRVPFDTIETFSRLSDRFRSNLQRLLLQEYSRSQMRCLVLGTMCADKRLAVFLLDLSARYAARRLSSCEFVLQMTRAEMGSQLGLKLETVSRAFSRFQEQGVLQVQGRLVKLLDLAALRLVTESG
jgi:CRP/FNR family transcriptional regulator